MTTKKPEPTALARRSPDEIQRGVDAFTVQMTRYLDSLGLPSDRVLVPVDERRKVILNLPGVVDLLAAEARRNATYISKFVAACGVGLFDAALNFLWDETVANLRWKVARFDLEYFFNSVVTDPDRKARLRTAEDLEKLEDWELIRGCHLTGVLSDIGFKHLDYIRNMRNWASAAHPNQNELSGLQVVAWLETCIREVIAKEPEGPAIEIRRLLNNIRTTTLTVADAGPIIANVERLPPDLSKSLLRTIFGMYTDPDMAATAKNNIKLISESVWRQAPDETRHEMGVKYAAFAANAEVARRGAAWEFLELVSGLEYLPEDALALELSERIRNLNTAHQGFNNFYTEPAHAKILLLSVPRTGVIPAAVRHEYVKTLTMCRIGNGYGVSRAAMSYYDELIERFQEPDIQVFAGLAMDTEVVSRLQFQSCASNFRALATELRERTSKSYTAAALDVILKATPQQLPHLGQATETRRTLMRLLGEAAKR